MNIVEFVDLIFPGKMSQWQRRILMKSQPEKKVEKTPECFGQFDLVGWKVNSENKCDNCPYIDRCIDARKDD